MVDSFRGTIVTIRKAVIPCAGLGTRFLPFTKVMAKELVPLLDKPLIHHAIDEAIASDIEEIVLVISPEKEALRTYLEGIPKKGLGKHMTDYPDLSSARGYSSWSGVISFVEQQTPRGLGHAVLMAEEAIGQEPFAVLLPDDLILSTRPTLKVMTELFEVYKSGLVAVEKVPMEKVGNYGIINPELVGEKVYKVNAVVEKPIEIQAPSDLAIVGRYIMLPAIFRFLEKTRPGAKGEIQLTDAIGLMLEEFPVFAYRFDGIRHDIGNPVGLFGASLALAKRREAYMDVLNNSLNEFVSKGGM
jgi:UTP--glucose-1-phosphate uridylyltransferase